MSDISSKPEVRAKLAPLQGAPGDPENMSPELRAALLPVLEGPGLHVRQQKEWSEILADWETRNRYEVSDTESRPVLYVGETGRGVLASLVRNLWAFRKIRLEFMTLGGILALVVTRPWTLFFARLEVSAWDGRTLGRIQQRFRLFGRAFDLVSPGGRTLARIESSFFHPWTFRVHQANNEIAVLKKKWSGLAKELLSTADNFEIQFHPSLTDGKLRQLLLCATLAIDLVFFEQRK